MHILLLGLGPISLRIYIFKNPNRFQISNIIIELILLNNSGWETRVSDVFMFNIK